MSLQYFAKDWVKHKMDGYIKPFHRFEDEENEIEEIDKALAYLVENQCLSSKNYDKELFDLHRKEVQSNFEIPWTGISNRMHRLIYSVNAIVQPKSIIGAGIFCGYTLICNVGASIGKGSCYKADKIIGIEIDDKAAKKAKANIAKIDKNKTVYIVTCDGIEWLRTFKNKIDLLYIDVTGDEKNTSLYLDILRSAYSSLNENSIVLAHNSVNGGENIKEYLEFVRNGKNFKKSINLIIDEAGLEFTTGKINWGRE